MSIHRVYIETPAQLPTGALTITGEEAKHAVRVKRVQAGEAVEVLDGKGHIAEARVVAADKGDRGHWRLVVNVDRVREAPRVRPLVHIASAVPKGPRVGDLIDGLSQAGATSWAPLRTSLGQSETGEPRLERLRRAAAEAAKQCGRAWMLEISEETELKQALKPTAGETVVLADAAGEPYRATGASAVRLLVGPEGGWTDEEMRQARESAAVIARFGPHVMRIEAAAVVAVAIILDKECRPGSV